MTLNIPFHTGVEVSESQFWQTEYKQRERSWVSAFQSLFFLLISRLSKDQLTNGLYTNRRRQLFFQIVLPTGRSPW